MRGRCGASTGCGVLSVPCRCVELGHELTVGGAGRGQVLVAFLTMAAGAILYVIAELLFTGRRLGAWDVTIWGVLLGFLVGLGTELVIVAAHA